MERLHAAMFMSYGNGTHLGVSLDYRVKEVYRDQCVNYAHDRQYIVPTSQKIRFFTSQTIILLAS